MFFESTKKFIYLGFLLHLIAVIFSIGYYNHDKQRQVLQMVGYKLSMFDKSYHDFQYFSEIRSWLHPIFYVFLGNIYLLFFQLNPFNLALVFRFFSSILGIFSIFYIWKTFQNEIQDEKEQSLFFIFSLSLWCIPFIHARTSNENICSSLFIFYIYFLKNNNSFKNNLLAGIFASITFFIRFQMAMAIISSLIWIFFHDKRSFKNLLQFSLGFFTILIFNTLIDYSFYGNWTFTPYNYIDVNFVKHYLNQFGSSPWYEYFKLVFKSGMPIGPLVVFIYLFYWIKNYKSFITSLTLPYFIIHCLIGHKELRFIFPMIVFFPLTYIELSKDLKILTNKIFLKSFIGLLLGIYSCF